VLRFAGLAAALLLGSVPVALAASPAYGQRPAIF
jgi:hypothetical protein